MLKKRHLLSFYNTLWY